MLFLLPILWATPNSDEILNRIQAYNELTKLDIPTLSKKQREALIKGEVVKLMQKNKGSSKGVEAGKVRAYYLTKVSKYQLWLAFQDGHLQAQERTIDYLYQQHSVDKMDWYGFIDLPWPLSDRHWLVRVWNNHEIAKKSNNEMWEHPWMLLEDGISLMKPRIKEGAVKEVNMEQFQNALYLPRSEGSWVTIDIKEHTLLVYSASADIGGSIPEGLMIRYLHSGLDKFIKDGEKRARDVVIKHYKEPHEPVYGGDGKPIPLH